MKKRKKTHRAFDANIQMAYLAGHRARLEGKPATACPSLIGRFTETYATRLMDAWMRGWTDRDREIALRAKPAAREWLPYKEES